MSKLLYTEIYSCDTFSQLTLHKGKYNKKINIYNQENKPRFITAVSLVNVFVG